MSLKYRISKKANQDLNSIWLYTLNKWSKDQADRYYNLIMDEVEFLAQNLYSGKSKDYIKEGYRSSTIKSHIIFYKISEDGILEVIRILHQKMDLESRLND